VCLFVSSELLSLVCVVAMRGLLSFKISDRSSNIGTWRLGDMCCVGMDVLVRTVLFDSFKVDGLGNDPSAVSLGVGLTSLEGLGVEVDVGHSAFLSMLSFISELTRCRTGQSGGVRLAGIAVP
jgi:hypothetical protein